MSNALSLCALVVMLAAAALTVYSFHHIFKKRVSGEKNLEVIQRQLRGFALLIVANLVMIIGMLVCTGTLFPYYKSLLKNALRGD